MNLAAQKIQMVMELRSMGIRDTRVLSALETVPREGFVPDAFLDQAYSTNMALPIGLGQTISQPFIVAKMTSELELEDKHRVLEIGTGSGYQTLILSKLARRVYTVERHKTLMQQAEDKFAEEKAYNITTKYGDGWEGWPEQAPIDRIIVTAAANDVPSSLVEQLNVGGIMIIPIGQHDQELFKVIKHHDGTVDMQPLLKVRFVPLIKGSLGT